MQTHRPDVHWWCPQLPPSPQQAMALLVDGTADWPTDSSAVIGSSLGGFYATVLAERRGCRAVLLNPAVDPARDLAGQLGEQAAWHDPAQRFVFTVAHVGELRAMTPTAITAPERYFAVIAKGDEVLDWREMRARYALAPGLLLEGSDHALSDFEQQLPQVLRFLDLA